MLQNEFQLIIIPLALIFYIGINERTLADQMDERIFDLHIQEKKIDRVKDYINFLLLLEVNMYIISIMQNPYFIDSKLFFK